MTLEARYYPIRRDCAAFVGGQKAEGFRIAGCVKNYGRLCSGIALSRVGWAMDRRGLLDTHLSLTSKV